MTTYELGKAAKEAEKTLSNATSELKNKALIEAAKAIEKSAGIIKTENQKDIDEARANGISESLIDRLTLTDARISDMAKGLLELTKLHDPIGDILYETDTKNGLQIKRKRVPIGVIGIIYEARPNVTVDAAGLCVKSGNAVLLRGGKEAINSNIVLSEILRNAFESAGLPKDCVCLITDTTRKSAEEMMAMREYLDVLIPRGGKGLIAATVEKSKVPVIETGSGNCHLFVDESADLQMAENILINGKCQRPSVCNALETLLVHENIAEKFLPTVFEALKNHATEIVGCEKTADIIPVALATEKDFATEFLDYKISVKVVKNVEEAISHIEKYSTHHSECIVSDNAKNVEKFFNSIDSAVLYHNASTRFTDGAQFGFGAEIGISTQKLHARGPMGVEQLTSIKYIVEGNGQIRN